MIKVQSVQQVRRTLFFSGYNSFAGASRKNWVRFAKTHVLVRRQEPQQRRIHNLWMFKKRHVRRVFHRQELGPRDRRPDLLVELEWYVLIVLAPDQKHRLSTPPDAGVFLRPIRRHVMPQGG